MNLKDAFLSLDNYFSPRIIGEVNDQYIIVASFVCKGSQTGQSIRNDGFFLSVSEDKTQAIVC